MRRCLHNHSDTLALILLRILANAMYEDSRLLIVGKVKGNPPSVQTAAMDVSMLRMGGKERSRDDWDWLTVKPGLVWK